MAKNKLTKEKASKAVKDTADFATDNWKPLLIVGGAVAVGYFLYSLSKKITDTATGLIPDLGNDPGAGGGNVNSGSGSDTVGGTGATITPNQAQIIAGALLSAMGAPGTDEQKIYTNLQGLNKKDFALVSEAFGTPRYDEIGGGEAPWLWPKRNLVYWLNAELGEDELLHLRNEVMPLVFATN